MRILIGIAMLGLSFVMLFANGGEVFTTANYFWRFAVGLAMFLLAIIVMVDPHRLKGGNNSDDDEW